MDINSENRDFIYPLMSPLHSAFEELANDLEMVAESQHTLITPSQPEQVTATFPPQPFSLGQVSTTPSIGNQTLPFFVISSLTGAQNAFVTSQPVMRRLHRSTKPPDHKTPSSP